MFAAPVGACQTAQRGEICAVAHDVGRAPLVERKVGALRGGAPVIGKHQALRSVVRLAIHTVAGFRWVKAHEKETADEGIPRPPWSFNQRADEQATRGVRSHVEDPRVHVGWEYVPWQSGV